MKRTGFNWGMSAFAACSFLLATGPVPPGPAVAGENIIRVATLSSFPPYCFDKENAPDLLEEAIPPGSDSSRLQGYAWDVVRESYHATGHTILLHVVPWSRGLHYVETGRVDVLFPAMKTAEREVKFIFSKEPVIHSAFVVYVPASVEFTWEGLQSLNGMRIVGVKGWAFGRQWEANHEIVKMDAYSILQGFEMVGKGWVFGMVGYDVPFDYVLRQEGLSGEFKKLPSWGSAQEFIMGAKTGKRTSELLSSFDLGKRSIEGNGTLDSIRTKWE